MDTMGYSLTSLRRLAVVTPSASALPAAGSGLNVVQDDMPATTANYVTIASDGGLLQLVGAGVGAADTTYIQRISALRRLTGSVNHWIEDPLIDLRFTLGAIVGAAGGNLSASERIAKTVELIADYTGGRYALKPVGSAGQAWAQVTIDGGSAPGYILRTSVNGEASGVTSWVPLFAQPSR